MDLQLDGGTAVLVVLVAAAGVTLAVFTATLGGLVLGLVIVLAIAYLVWVLGGRLHDSLRHGKPLIRRGRGGED